MSVEISSRYVDDDFGSLWLDFELHHGGQDTPPILRNSRYLGTLGGLSLHDSVFGPHHIEQNSSGNRIVDNLA